MAKKLYKYRSLDRLGINIMKIISFIVGLAHLFVPTLSLNLFKPKILQKFSNSPFGSINMADTDQINVLQCSRPCQRVPNFVKLSSVLIQYGIPKNIVNSIEAKESNSYGEVDIGKCIGSCRHVQSQILTVSTEKTAKKRGYENGCFKKSAVKFKLILRTTNWDVSQMSTEISKPKFALTIKSFQGQSLKILL